MKSANIIGFFKKYFDLIIILLITIWIKYILISFGKPYILHPDETIYKDPLKILLQFKNLNFSDSFNFVDLLLSLWTFIMFAGGYCLQVWHSFHEFKNALLAEDWSIIFGYRLLSLVVSAIAIAVLYNLICKITTAKIFRALFILTIIFNPIDLLANNLIKFDPYVYLFLSILLNYSYSYFIQNIKEKRSTLYVLSIVAISARIELAAFFLSIFIYDMYLSYSATGKKEFFGNLKTITKYILAGAIIYSCITLIPATYLYNHFFSPPKNIGVSRSFHEFIFSGLIKNIFNENFIKSITGNALFYLTVALAALGPVILIGSLLGILKTKDIKYLGLFSLFISIGILLYGYKATHYLLLLSVVMIMTNFFFILSIKKYSIQLICSLFNFIFVSSLSILLLFNVYFCEDPRITSKSYILDKTLSSDLLAIETHSMNGYGPPISECKDVLLAKSAATAEMGGGTGETYLIKANSSISDCRNILDIFTEDYFAKTIHAGKWIIDYDSTAFIQRNPKYYITIRDLHSKEYSQKAVVFHDFILSHYKLEKSFTFHTWDYRLRFLLSSEYYLKNEYFYVRS